jgi:hypothetical protein
MNAKLPLAQRRALLVERAMTQRVRLAQQILPWRAPLGLADRGLALLRHLREHPQWLLGGIAVFLVIRPRLMMKWLRHGWVGWQMAQSLRR